MFQHNTRVTAATLVLCWCRRFLLCRSPFATDRRYDCTFVLELLHCLVDLLAVDKGIKGDPDHPNALFVARVTNGGTCQVMWMLNDPDAAASYLDKMIADGSAVREFEYSIEGDPQWESIGWFLQDFSKNK